jgi:hypothetical protein
MNEEMKGLIRHTLTTVGGALVTKGLVDSSTLNDAAGAIVILIGVAWSLTHKASVKNQIAQAALTGNSKPNP